MSDWQRTLDIQDSWQKALDFEISYQELAGVIAEKLKALKKFDEEDIEYDKAGLIEDFEIASEDDELEEDGINYLMSNLYDWGDVKLDNKFGGKKVCWVKTNF